MPRSFLEPQPSFWYYNTESAVGPVPPIALRSRAGSSDWQPQLSRATLYCVAPKCEAEIRGTLRGCDCRLRLDRTVLPSRNLLQDFSANSEDYGSFGVVLALSIWPSWTALVVLIGAQLNGLRQEVGETLHVTYFTSKCRSRRLTPPRPTQRAFQAPMSLSGICRIQSGEQPHFGRDEYLQQSCRVTNASRDGDECL